MNLISSLKPFFYRIWQNFRKIFSKSNLIWHAAAIFFTFISVVFGFDRFYFENTRSLALFYILIPSAVLGFAVPILTPVILLIIGKVKRSKRALNAGYAITQSAALAWLVSSAYKALTGRSHPDVSSFVMSSSSNAVIEEFHFGFFREGIFWGWPSSHTAVAFAIAFTLISLFPNRKIKASALFYAFYIGIGVSATIHWFSDFAAGAILGTLIGIVVGKAYQHRKEIL